MIFYLGFTILWTLIVIRHASLGRIIHHNSIIPIARRLAYHGIPNPLRQVITGLLQLSIIPLGFLWAIFLMIYAWRLSSLT